MKKKNHWKKLMCAFLRILHGVFDSSRRCVLLLRRMQQRCRQRAGSEAAENPSPAEESGADSTEGAQNTINQESAAQTGNAGQTGRSADRGCSADGCSADRWCSAGGCGTEYGVWGRPEYGAHPDGGVQKALRPSVIRRHRKRDFRQQRQRAAERLT